ncbi:MAG: Hsp20/alpha crystallin family protein [Candidatus Hydrogenedentota bacterium]|nr:MAG: Hsp20/alpha crystallin family protein [Candidatus Hydrogenedentota bacterium]
MLRRGITEQTKTNYRTPRVEIYETSDSVILHVEMPGVEKEDFEISIDGGELTIRGKRKPRDSGLKLIHGESDHADYLRIFSLGDELDTSNVGARVDNGILTLTLHKKPEILPKKVSIEVE